MEGWTGSGTDRERLNRGRADQLNNPSVGWVWRSYPPPCEHPRTPTVKILHPPGPELSQRSAGRRIVSTLSPLHIHVLVVQRVVFIHTRIQQHLLPAAAAPPAERLEAVPPRLRQRRLVVGRVIEDDRVGGAEADRALGEGGVS